jgi:HAE1 family hydrophobic/amphiphilic exporter-1
VQLPDGASLERTQTAMDEVGEIAKRPPGVEQVINIAASRSLDNSARWPMPASPT